MKIGVELNHGKCLGILRDAQVPPPRIPRGKNTVWKHFQMPDGSPALVVNQSGFARELEDNEEEVNGLCLYVARCEDNEERIAAPSILERKVMEMLELTEPPAQPQGRPPGENDGVIRLRLPLAEKGQWVRQAREAGMNLSEWIRMRCNS